MGGRILGTLLVVIAVVAIVLAIVRMVRGSRPERQLDWFCYQYEVAPVGAARDCILAYLRRTRAWRVAGATFGIGLTTVLRMTGTETVDLYTGLFAGWFAAGLVAELAPGRRRRGERRVASLAPRTVDRFLPPVARTVLTTSLLGAALAVVFAVAARTMDPLGHRVKAPPPWSAIVLGGATAILVSLIAALGLHRLLHKPYPVDDSQLDAAEYAIRTAAVVRVVAGWAALLCIVTFRLSLATLDGTRAPWSWAPGVLCVAGFVGIVIAWAWVPTRVVRRTQHRLGTA